jgi:hypothetical protein
MNTSRYYVLHTADETFPSFTTWDDAVSHAYNVAGCEHDYEFTIDEHVLDCDCNEGSPDRLLPPCAQCQLFYDIQTGSIS